ncbi:MAG: alpha/beta hydrolase [Hydrocarboniphaga sp.]|uniref:YqiA/YcfP family alpha/beta fold hydrolase n=1 Tax=Hydrocarboniphaga sp. TaxID=2033016 RepID=UPI00261D1CC1|nr:YqiA/YcfP family alpha/beta fold hydrolase [Hydrocarboniphaga sp.]MDB5970712.1 alpha/beta hydrolase [Hydrocarboniphaga sp.]
MKPDKLVCFAHGKESGPWGIKITHLAEIARGRGFDVISPDYSHTSNPRQRVAELHTLAPSARTLVLAGSSMGGYVSARACRQLAPAALFLMAPALYFPHYDEEPEAIPALCSVVHGWDDEIVPFERALRFAQRHRADLHMLRSDHSLNDRLPELGVLFADLLDRATQVSAP